MKIKKVLMVILLGGIFTGFIASSIEIQSNYHPFGYMIYSVAVGLYGVGIYKALVE